MAKYLPPSSLSPLPPPPRLFTNPDSAYHRLSFLSYGLSHMRTVLPHLPTERFSSILKYIRAEYEEANLRALVLYH